MLCLTELFEALKYKRVGLNIKGHKMVYVGEYPNAIHPDTMDECYMFDGEKYNKKDFIYKLISTGLDDEMVTGYWVFPTGIRNKIKQAIWAKSNSAQAVIDKSKSNGNGCQVYYADDRNNAIIGATSILDVI